jgi:3',5'-cyclic-AMP phosphodiesterase
MTVGVLQVSDVHVTSSEPPEGSADPEERLDAVLAAALARFGVPDLVVASGDLTDDGSLSACALLADRLHALGAPVLAVPGNHDDPAVVTGAFGPPVSEVGRWRLVGIDTSRPRQVHGTVDVADVRRRLDGLDERPTLVVLHHPPVAPSTNPWFRLDHATELGEALAERRHVKAVLSGHLHVPFEADVAGVPVLGAPSTWVGIHHDGDAFVVGGDDRTGARWLDLHDDATFTTTLLQA